MAFGYEVHPHSARKAAAPTPFHHPPRPLVERSRTAPVVIPKNNGPAINVPPPLPPPRSGEVDEDDLGWHMANRDERGRPLEQSTPIRPGSSLLGGSQYARLGKTFSVPERNIDFSRRQVPIPSPPAQPGPSSSSSSSSAPGTLFSALKEGAKKEEIVPASPPFPDLRRLMEYNKLQSEKHMSNDTLRRSSQAYDQQLLSKIKSSPGQPVSPGAVDEATSSTNRLNRLNGQLLALNAGATPPSGSAPGVSALKSPLSDGGLEHSRLHSFSRRASQHKHSSSDNIHSDRLQSPGMAELSLQDRSPKDEYQNAKTGQKRRAQSPPAEDSSSRVSSSSGQQQSQWQRNPTLLPPDQIAQMQRLQGSMPPNSLSTVASSGPGNSYASSNLSLSQPSTAATSYTSETLQSVQQSGVPPGSSAGSARRPLGVFQPKGVGSMIPPGMPSVPMEMMRPAGQYICDCCPKKPRRFYSEEELRIHEMEKQYICQYCNHRFKNKNEAERHQNSLHLRRHSWSCSALTTFEAAFHPTPVNTLAAQIPGQNTGSNATQQFHGMHSTATDTCGYCGQEFVNPPNWEERVNHLNQIHKFGECNQSKKFFRADHFRQHLKHSHAGTSGKWTNMLEQACMKDEPPPQPPGPGMPPVPNALPSGIPGIAMIGQRAIREMHQHRQVPVQSQQTAQAQPGQQATGPGQPTNQQQNPYQQFPLIQALQNYQPPSQQQSNKSIQPHQQPQPQSPPTAQQQAQQAQSLAQHLQQAQREMSAMGAAVVANSSSPQPDAGSHGNQQQ